MSSVKNTKVVFILTNLAFQAVIGQIGVYSICKSPMAQAYKYLFPNSGIIEAITLIGEIIGSLSILFMPVKPVTGFLMLSIINAAVGLLLFIPPYVKASEIKNLIVIFVLFVQTFFISSLAFAQIIFSQYYDDNSKKYQHSIWYSLTFLGDIFSILLTQYAIYNFGISWEWAKMIWALYILFVAVLMYFYFDDHSEATMEIDEMLSVDHEEGEDPQHLDKTAKQTITKAQQCKILFIRAWSQLKKLNIFLVTVSFGLIEGLYSNLLFWAPYYYITIDERAYSMSSILGCCLSIALGGILIEILFFEILGLQKHSKSIAYFLLLLSATSYSILWAKRQSGPQLQIILLCLSNFLIASPYNRISTVEPIQEANKEPHRIKTVFLLAHLARNIFAAISTMIIGFLMKMQAINFWHVVIVNVGLVVVVETIRKVRNSEKDAEIKKIEQ